MRHATYFWGILFLFFILWILRVLYLPSEATDTGSAFIINTGLRLVLFFCPFLLAAIFLFKETLKESFALVKPTVTGSLLALIYSLALIVYELLKTPFILNTNPFILLSFPFAPIIEELVFRGFVFTHLLKLMGRIPTILISSLLFTLIHVPGWIFIAELKGEAFLTVTGQVFIFGLIQGIIRYYSKSVYPNIAIHLVNNALLISL